MSFASSRTITVFVVVAAAIFGYFAWRQLEKAATPETAIPAAGLARLQATALPDTSGRSMPLAAWKGKVLVVNFWATWCPPCRKEMPAFSRISDKFSAKGVQFVGIGIDSPSAIKEFALQTPVSYPLLIGGSEGLELARQLGNATAALPYTLVVSRDGRAVLARLGMIEEGELEAVLAPLIGG